MNNITSIRLINRIFLRNDEAMLSVLKLAKHYNLCIVVGNNGGYAEGPFVSNLYTKEPLEARAFIDFVKELLPFCDMYSGVKSYTYLETEIQYVLENQGSYTGVTKFIAYYDYETNTACYRAIEPDDDIVRAIPIKSQSRITSTHIQEASKEAMLFTGSS